MGGTGATGASGLSPLYLNRLRTGRLRERPETWSRGRQGTPTEGVRSRGNRRGNSWTPRPYCRSKGVRRGCPEGPKERLFVYAAETRTEAHGVVLSCSRRSGSGRPAAVHGPPRLRPHPPYGRGPSQRQGRGGWGGAALEGTARGFPVVSSAAKIPAPPRRPSHGPPRPPASLPRELRSPRWGPSVGPRGASSEREKRVNAAGPRPAPPLPPPTRRPQEGGGDTTSVAPRGASTPRLPPGSRAASE